MTLMSWTGDGGTAAPRASPPSLCVCFLWFFCISVSVGNGGHLVVTHLSNMNTQTHIETTPIVPHALTHGQNTETTAVGGPLGRYAPLLLRLLRRVPHPRLCECLCVRFHACVCMSGRGPSPRTRPWPAPLALCWRRHLPSSAGGGPPHPAACPLCDGNTGWHEPSADTPLNPILPLSSTL